MNTIRIIRWSAAIAAGAALARAAPAGPPPPDVRLGVMTHFAQGWDPAWIPQLAPVAATQVRDELYWDTVESHRRQFDFPPQYDRYMARLDQAGVTPLIVLSFENGNYDNNDTPHSDEALAAFAQYAVEVLRHYGRQIKAVEIWNEYNGTFCRGPATLDRPGNYLRMLAAVSAVIRRERPDVTLVGGATAGIPLPYWEKLLAGGALDFVDALSVHPYRYDLPPEGIESEIADLQELVVKYHHGAPKPLWVTEIGWYLRPSRAPGDLAIDEATQANFLVRACTLLLSADVQRVYWYLLRDDQGLAMGLVRDNGQPRPAGTAMATLIRQLDQAHFVEREDAADNLYSLLFRRPSGEEIRVMWALAPMDVDLTGATGAVDVSGNPVRLAGSMKIGDSPVFVTGPVDRLPSAEARVTILADSRRDFSNSQAAAWSYGTVAGDSDLLVPLCSYEVTDWSASWTGPLPYIAVTAGDQHPSLVDGRPVSAVRRWRSDLDGTVRVVGQFRSGLQGDGVGVSVAVDGQRRFRRLLGGGNGNTIVQAFDFTTAVHPGSTIDFAVDPGPAANIDYDATAVSVTISEETSK